MKIVAKTFKFVCEIVILCIVLILVRKKCS